MTIPTFIGVGAGVVAGALLLDRVANAVVKPRRRPGGASVAKAGLQYEDVVIEGLGYPLAGWLVCAGSARSDAPLVVMAHGWGADHGTMLKLGRPLVLGGHDVLLFDMRGHGRNDDEPFVTIRHLRDDVMAVVAYAKTRFPQRQLVLVGHSFGGAACVLAAAEGSTVAGLVLIATPSDPMRITAEFLTEQGMPGGLMTTILRPFWWWRIGCSFRALSPELRIGEVDVPMLILQPEHDRRVSREHAERLAAASTVSYRLIGGREHTDALESSETLALVDRFVRGLAHPGFSEVQAHAGERGA